MKRKRQDTKIWEFIDLSDSTVSKTKGSTTEEKRLIFFLLALTCVTLSIVTNIKTLPVIIVCLLLSIPGLKSTLCDGKTKCECEGQVWLSLCITSALTSILFVAAYIYFWIIKD